jgi:hypothetical protein
MSYAELADKYRNQRDALAEGLVAIVKEDAEGKGMFAKMAMETLERMAATTHLGIPEKKVDLDGYCPCGKQLVSDEEHRNEVCRDCL